MQFHNSSSLLFWWSSWSHILWEGRQFTSTVRKTGLLMRQGIKNQMKNVAKIKSARWQQMRKCGTTDERYIDSRNSDSSISSDCNKQVRFMKTTHKILESMELCPYTVLLKGIINKVITDMAWWSTSQIFMKKTLSRNNVATETRASVRKTEVPLTPLTAKKPKTTMTFAK